MSGSSSSHSFQEGTAETLKRRKQPSRDVARPELPYLGNYETFGSVAALEALTPQQRFAPPPPPRERFNRGSSEDFEDLVPHQRYRQRASSPPLGNQNQGRHPRQMDHHEEAEEETLRFAPVPLFSSPAFPPTATAAVETLPTEENWQAERENGGGVADHFHRVRLTERRMPLGKAVGNAFARWWPESERQRPPRRQRCQERGNARSFSRQYSDGEPPCSMRMCALVFLWLIAIAFLIGCGVGTFIYLNAQQLMFHSSQIRSSSMPANISPDPRAWAPLLLSQSQFVSCNRHELPQYYWNVMSQTALAEVHGVGNGKDGDRMVNAGFSVEGCTHWNGSLPGGTLQKQIEETSTPAPPLDAFIWLGDIIYSDKEMLGGPPPPPPSPSRVPAPVYPLDMIREMWETQFNHTEYRLFRETCVRQDTSLSTIQVDPSPSMSNTVETRRSASAVEHLSGHKEELSNMSMRSLSPLPAQTGPVGKGPRPAVWGVWDDHDMGQNDAGKEFPWKNVTRGYLFDFLQLPPEDPRRHREEGVYTFHTISTAVLNQHLPSIPGATEQEISYLSAVREGLQLLYENLFCVCLLDVRSLRDPANSTESGDMLGEAQWEWLERVLIERVVPSTSEPKTGGPAPRQKCAAVLIGGGVQMFLDEKVTEHWGSYPKSRDRILQTLRRHRVERVVFLSGDVHMGELGADFSSFAVQHILGYPVVEATSSGLTHSAESTVSSDSSKGILAALRPMRWLVPSMFPSPRRVGLYVGKNFGSVKMEVGLRDNETVMKERTQALLLGIYALKNESLKSNTSVVHGTPDAAESMVETKGVLGDKVIALQQQLDAVINITLTIFSLDDSTPAMAAAKAHLRPNLPAPIGAQFSFPLHMLTYAGGPCYVNSVVNPHIGRVYPSPEASCALSLSGTAGKSFSPPAGFDEPQHYPRTAPLPLLTRVVQWIQRRYYPDERMLFVVYLSRSKAKEWVHVFRVAILVLWCILAVVGVWWVLRKPRERRSSRAQDRVPLREGA